MKFRRFLILLLLALVCFGHCFAEESSSVTLTYTDDAQLETGIRAAVSDRCESLCIIDGVSADFDPDALFDTASELLTALTPEFGCVPSGHYSYSDEQRSILVSIRYLTSADLPEPFLFEFTGRSVSYQITASDGVISHSDTLGRRTLLIFGRSSCVGTRSLLDSLYGWASVLKGDADVIVCTLSSGADELAVFESAYPLFTCASADLKTAQQLLSVFDPSLSSFMTPMVFLQDTDGTLIFHSSGTVAEPARIASTAIGTDRSTFNLPAGLASIGAEAFAGCSNIKAVTVPDSVREIGADAFADCPGVTLLCSADSFTAQYADKNGLNRIEP